MIEFSGIDSLFADKLHALVKARKAEVVASVVGARGVTDYAGYLRLIGHIEGLEEVLSMFETVAHRIAEEGRRK